MKPPPPDALPLGFDDGADRWRPPPVSGDRLRRFAITIFLISLTSLFTATLIAYIFIRIAGPESMSSGRVVLPRGLWVSTAVLLLCGLFVAMLQRAAKAAELRKLRSLVTLTWLTSLLFLAVQTPSVWSLS